MSLTPDERIQNYWSRISEGLRCGSRSLERSAALNQRSSASTPFGERSFSDSFGSENFADVESILLHRLVAYLHYRCESVRRAREDLILPSLISVRCYARDEFRRLPVALRLLKFVHKLPVLHLNRAL